MSNYKRSKTPGASYFFTVVTYKRQEILTHPESRKILRKIILDVKKEYPFKIDAWVLLPEHIHSIWTLPTGDHDFSKRWGLIKAGFSSHAKTLFHHPEWINNSKKSIGKEQYGNVDFGNIKSVIRQILICTLITCIGIR